MALALFGATALPLVVAIVDIGESSGQNDRAVGASPICAGMASVLVFPILATRLTGRGEPGEGLPVREL